MANKQIEEFPLVTTADGSDIVHISRGGADRSITVSDLIPDAGTTGTVIVNTFKEGVEFTGGVSNSVNISQEVVSKSNIWVFFDGVYQEKETYEISSNIVIFNEVIPVGVSTIEILTPLVLEVGQTTANNVQFSTNGNVEELLGKTLVFASVAAIQAADWLKVGMFCSTLGYSAAGDGGDNTYQIVAAGTGTADGGNFIDLPASGLQAKGLFTKGYRDPRQFGNPDAVISFISGDATPSVGQGNYFLTDGATTITNFDNGRVGQTIHVQATGNITVQNNANISLSDGSDYAMVSGDVLVLTQYTSGVWTEEARGASSGGGGITLIDSAGPTVVGVTELNFEGYGPPGFLQIVDNGGGSASVRVKSGTTFLPGDTAYLFGAEGGLTGSVNLVFPEGNGIILQNSNAQGGLFRLGHSSADTNLDFSADSTVTLVSSNVSAGVNSIQSKRGPSDFQDIISWSDDGVDTTLELKHNNNNVIVIDSNGTTIPVDTSLRFGTSTISHSSGDNALVLEGSSGDVRIGGGTTDLRFKEGSFDGSDGVSIRPSPDSAGGIVLVDLGNGGGGGTKRFAVGSLTVGEGFVIEADVDASTDTLHLGFFDSPPVAQPVVTGDKATNLEGVVTSLLTALNSLGLIDDQTT